MKGLKDKVAIVTNITGTDITVDGGYSVMGPERAEPPVPK